MGERTVAAAGAAMFAAVLAVVALVALGGLAACADQEAKREGHLRELLALLPGRYDNGAQAALDARAGTQPGHIPVALTIVRVDTPRLGHHVFYAEEQAADDPRRVLSRKMYGFRIAEKRGIVETVYEFVEPQRWRSGLEDKDLFTAVMKDDVQAEGCELLWKRDGPRFVATHDPKVCPEPGGAAGAPQAELAVGTLSIGGYHFRKTH